jgi:ABC-type polysaccharide/polyol phosphate transport system ATPase subunit
MQDIGREIIGRKHGGSGGLRPDEFWAVDNISFEMKRGECLGLIGHNGAGKTTMLRMLNGLIKPDQGRIEMRGRVGALIALGAGFNPILTGRENVYVNASVLGLRKKEIDEKIDEIIDFAEIGEFIDAPVQSYSSGMQVRLGFAVASTLNPDILILDEVLAVGDTNFQSKCFQRIGKLVERAAVILVSHYPHHIKKMCDRVLLLRQGIVHECGTADHVLAIYQASIADNREPLCILGDKVNSAIIKDVTEKVQYGECLEFDLLTDISESVNSGQSYINIVDKSEIVHAQVVIDGLIKLSKKGLNRHRIKIGPLHLSTGNYSGNFMLYGQGGKTTIVHLRHSINFEFIGETNIGALYYPPCNVLEI